jgi:hypothetical protein
MGNIRAAHSYPLRRLDTHARDASTPAVKLFERPPRCSRDRQPSILDSPKSRLDLEALRRSFRNYGISPRSLTVQLNDFDNNLQETGPRIISGFTHCGYGIRYNNDRQHILRTRSYHNSFPDGQLSLANWVKQAIQRIPDNNGLRVPPNARSGPFVPRWNRDWSWCRT